MAHTHKAAPHVSHSHRQSIPCPPAWHPPDDGATDHHQHMAHRLVSGAGACIVLSSRIFPAPMVDSGDGTCGDQVLAELCGSAGVDAPGGRRDGDRAPWLSGDWQGSASRWGAVLSQLYGLSLRPSVGGPVDARQVAARDTPVGSPHLGRLGPPRVRSCAWHAAYNPGAHSPAAAGVPDALDSAASLHLHK
jgi:hypothetical protein